MLCRGANDVAFGFRRYVGVVNEGGLFRLLIVEHFSSRWLIAPGNGGRKPHTEKGVVLVIAPAFAPAAWLSFCLTVDFDAVAPVKGAVAYSLYAFGDYYAFKSGAIIERHLTD